MEKMKKARTIQDIKNHPFIEKDKNGNACFHSEEDFECKSYWGYLKSGYRTSDNDQHTIHESTIKDFCIELNNARIWLDDPDLEGNEKQSLIDQFIIELQELSPIEAFGEIASSGLSDSEIAICVKTISENETFKFKK